VKAAAASGLRGSGWENLMSEDRSRKTYYIDDDTYAILSKMAVLTGKDMSALINDAIRSQYSLLSSLSKQEMNALECLATSVLSIFGVKTL
jgi:hypothetical protein